MHEANSLPDDLDACHRLIQQQQAELESQSRQLHSRESFVEEQSRTVVELASAREKLSQENEELKLTVEKLLARLYGNRSERFVDGEGQLKFDFGDDQQAAVEALEEAIAEAEQTIEEAEEKRKARRKARKNRRSEQFPEHLPRYEKIVDLPDEEKAGKVFVGYDTVETLEFERPKLRVRQTKFAKYADRGHPDRGIFSPERPTGLVEGNRFDTSVAVEIIAAKYFYHLPYYRQQDLFAGSGWMLSRSTLLNILTAAEFALQPLAMYYRDLISQVGIIGCDETTVKLIVPPELPPLDPDHPRTARITEVLTQAQAEGRRSVGGKMWAYRAVELPFEVFDFTVSRHRDGPDEVLSNFRGKLMGDCWSGFQKIYMRSDSRIERAACWAHARRKIEQCLENHPQQVTVLLGLIRQLYDLEDRAKECSVAQRQSLRQRQSRLVLEQIKNYINGEAVARVLPKSDLGEGLSYLRRHWEALELYVSDGRLPIDNNETEQLMRRVALGRKNWLFLGSLAAGDRAANLLTIISTAVRNDLDVWAYLKGILDRILDGCTDWGSLRADNWKAANPKAIRQYRAEERRDAVDRRRVRRARRRLLSAKRK